MMRHVWTIEEDGLTSLPPVVDELGNNALIVVISAATRFALWFLG